MAGIKVPNLGIPNQQTKFESVSGYEWAFRLTNFVSVLAGSIGGPGGGGTVTSVGLVEPVEFIVSGSPVTGSGTLTVTKAVENANTVWAGPTSGVPAIPTFRHLVPADFSTTFDWGKAWIAAHSAYVN